MESKKSKLIYCTCVNEYQDKKYGKGKRLHNETSGRSSKNPGNWRCTVCGKTVSG